VGSTESSRAEACANLKRRRLAVQAEVRSVITDLTNAQEQIRLQTENVEIAQENRRIVRAGYLAGTETLNRLNEAQRDLVNAQADLASARIRMRQAWSDLRAAAGTNGAGEDDPPPASQNAGSVAGGRAALQRAGYSPAPSSSSILTALAFCGSSSNDFR